MSFEMPPQENGENVAAVQALVDELGLEEVQRILDEIKRRESQASSPESQEGVVIEAAVDFGKGELMAQGSVPCLVRDGMVVEFQADLDNDDVHINQGWLDELMQPLVDAGVEVEKVGSVTDQESANETPGRFHISKDSLNTAIQEGRLYLTCENTDGIDRVRVREDSYIPTLPA